MKTGFGYHIIKLTGIRSWEECDQAQVKRALLEEKRAQVFEKYMDELKKRAKPFFVNEALLGS